MLRPRQETETPVRVTRESRRSVPREGVTEALKVTNLSHVYSGASVLPAQFTQLRVRVVNGDTRQQVLRIGTRLDKLQRAEIVERNSEPLSKDPLTSDVDVIEQTMSSLPKKLTKEQQRAVRELVLNTKLSFSKESTTSGGHRMWSTASTQELIVLLDKLSRDIH